MERLFVLIRRGQSEGDARKRFTGHLDADLTGAGMAEARAAGGELGDANIRFDAAFASSPMRARRTCVLILEECDRSGLEPVTDDAPSERDCGETAGPPFDEVCARRGREQVAGWIGSHDGAPPGGESFRNLVARVLPFCTVEILPGVMRGERVLVAGHNNAPGALAVALKGLPLKEMPAPRLPNAAPLLYRLNGDTSIKEKQLL